MEERKKKGLCYNYDKKFDAPIESIEEIFKDAMENIMEEPKQIIKENP